MWLEFVEFSGLLTPNHKPKMEDGQRGVGKSVQRGELSYYCRYGLSFLTWCNRRPRLYILSCNLYSLKVLTVEMHNPLENHKMLDHFVTGLIPISHYSTILEPAMYRVHHMFVYLCRGIEAVRVAGEKPFGKRLPVWCLLKFPINAT